MSIEVSIKQRFFGNKTMPLEVILGESLHYGHFTEDKLTVGKLGASEFIAYNPQSIGRGFSVVWNPKEKKNINLHLPLPSTVQELTDFYAAVERMAKYWDAKLVVDGNKVSLDTFMAGFQNMLEFNEHAIKHFSQQILDKEDDRTFVFYSTMWPLSIGKEEATLFLNDPDSYAKWLHEKQSVDVYYVTPSFYIGDNGIFAKYLLFNDLPSVFPNVPFIPVGMTDPITKKPLKCDQWIISFQILGEIKPLCEMEYSEFLSILPEDKKSKYDADHFLLSALTEEELRALSAK